jgi:hypothetical protein
LFAACGGTIDSDSDIPGEIECISQEESLSARRKGREQRHGRARSL